MKNSIFLLTKGKKQGLLLRLFIKSTAMLLIFLFAFPAGVVLGDERNVDKNNTKPVEKIEQTRPSDQENPGTPSTSPTFEVTPSGKSRKEDKKSEPEKEAVMLLTEEEQNNIVENPSTVKSLLPDIDTFSGSLIYNYPIVLPPGRDSLTPSLELTYNSGLSINNSILGYNWYISIPYIERINRKGSDQLYSRNDFTSSLSGELVAKNGTTTFASKTEDGSFLDYQRFGNKWIVTDKQGTKYTFGSTTQSRLDNASSTSEVYKWMVEEIRDTNDNFIRFEYAKDQNQIYPSKVFYTGHGVTDGIFEVDFVYENRDDNISNFSSKFEVVTSKRLEKIEIKTDGVLSKEYSLDYVSGHNGERSLLNSITVSGGAATLPATEFEYQTMPANLEFNSSVFQPPSYYRPSTTDYYFIELKESIESTNRLVDVNGDGLLDFIRTANSENSDGIVHNINNDFPRVFLNTGNSWEFDPDLYQLPSYYRPSTNDYKYMALNDVNKLVDVNGDNLPDFVHTSDVADADGIITNNNDGFPRVYLNTGEGWEFNPDHYQLPSYYRPSTNDYFFFQTKEEEHDSTQLLDVNGDGLPDFVRTSDGEDADGIILNNNNSAPRVYLNTGNGWEFNPDKYQLPTYYRPATSDYYFMALKSVPGSTNRLIDVNADNLPDFVRTSDGEDSDGIISNNNGDSPRVYLNTGNGWEFNPDKYQLPTYYRPATSDYYFMALKEFTQLADVNGDGLPDFVRTSEGEHATGVMLNLNGDGPRVFLNTGNGWKFDSGLYQWPAFYKPATNNYEWRALKSSNQLIDLNGDSLLDFVRTSAGEDADGLILNNNGDGSRAYINTGKGWEFNPDLYQLPSYYRASTTDYYFMQLSSYSDFSDINNDGLQDFIKTAEMADSDGLILNNNGDGPRMYQNVGETVDYLSTITFPQGGDIHFDYKLELIKGRNPSNPYYSQNVPVLKDMVTNDGFGNLATSTYQYKNGEYYYHNDPFKQFTGFGEVDKTDALGNVTKSYFHQGNATATSTGEYDNHISKIGKPYRIEQYDASGNLFSKTINKWDKYDTVTAAGATSTFVKLAQTLEVTYDGDSDHKDKAESYSYNDTNGNISQKISWGEVSGSNDGSFSDTGSDKISTALTYATSSATSTLPAIFLPSRELVTDQSGTTVKDTKSYYDTLSFGAVDKGNLTKQEMLKSGSSYIDVEKTYNSYGLVTQEKDPRDKATTYAYDAFNLYPATTTDPLGHYTTAVYDYSLGKPKQVMDANNRVFQVVYDGLDRVIEEKQPDATTPTTLVTKSTYAYTDDTFPTSVTKTDYLNGLATASSTVPSYAYFDGLGRVIQERRHAEGTGSGGSTNNFSVKDTTYNLLGQKSRESLPYFGTGSARTSPTGTSALWNNFTYDALGRIKTIANVVGTTTNAYDDWKLTVTDANGDSKDLYKDAQGNLVQVDEHNGASTYSTYYEWNPLGNLTKITDALGNIRNFTYDKLGRRLTAEDLHFSGDSNFSTWTYGYDDASNMTTMVDGKAQTIKYTYDDTNRMLSEDLFGVGGTDGLYTYDSCTGGVGKLCFATSTDAVSGNTVSSYAYDALGRAISETKSIAGNLYTTSYEYDRAGNPTLVTTPDGAQVKYEFNPAGLTEKIARKEAGAGSFVGVVEDFDYSPESKLVYQNNHNETQTTNTYDANHLYRLSSKFTDGPLGGITNVLQDLHYTYDSVGNITQLSDISETNNSKTINYTYDDLSRLLTASSTAVGGGPAYREVYTYGATGNILSKNWSTGSSTYAYDADTYAKLMFNPQAVTSALGVEYDYDENGNMVTSGTATSTYNYKNQMVGMTAGATTTTYAYDHTGERTKYSNGVTTTFYPNKLYNITPQSGGTATTTTSHIFLGDTMIATVEKVGTTSPAIHYIHTDHLSGANLSTDYQGLVTEITDFYPYGGQRLEQSYNGSFKEQRKFTGHEYDTDTDLTYAGARYYNANMGRFTSIDPAFIKFDPNSAQGKMMLMDPQHQNSYSYARNNPLVYTDPDGEFAQIIAGVAIGAAVGGVIGGTVSAMSGNGFWQGAKYGAISGATAGLVVTTAGMGAAALGLTSSEAIIGGSAVGNALGNTAARTAAGQSTTPGDVGMDLVTGGAAGIINVGVLKYQGSIGENGNYIPTMSVKNLPADAKTLLGEYQSNGWSKAQSGPTGDPHPWKNLGGELPSKGTVIDAQYTGSDGLRGWNRFVNTGQNKYFSDNHYGKYGPIPFYKLKK